MQPDTNRKAVGAAGGDLMHTRGRLSFPCNLCEVR